MNRRDQDLLEKQLHGLTVAPRNSGVIMTVALAVVFLAGLTFGELWTAARSGSAPQILAANDVVLPHQVPQSNFWQ